MVDNFLIEKKDYSMIKIFDTEIVSVIELRDGNILCGTVNKMIETFHPHIPIPISFHPHLRPKCCSKLRQDLLEHREPQMWFKLP